MKRQIIIDVEVGAFDNAEQERYVLATIEDAFGEAWFDWLANEEIAPQQFTNVRARFAERIRS